MEVFRLSLFILCIRTSYARPSNIEEPTDCERQFQVLMGKIDRLERTLIEILPGYSDPATTALPLLHEPRPCGTLMHYLGPVGSSSQARGFDSLCYISLNNDTSLILKPCNELLANILERYTDAAALLAADGRFGCQAGSDSLLTTDSEQACQAGLQNDMALVECPDCTAIVVCIDVPVSLTIRLVGGGGVHEGRVEVLYSQIWGTVCDDDFSDVDASVVCRSLGFTAGFVQGPAAFGQGSGHIWLDDVACHGNETSIEECHHRGWGITNCSHGEDVGVMCNTCNEELKDKISFSSTCFILSETNFTSKAALFFKVFM